MKKLICLLLTICAAAIFAGCGDVENSGTEVDKFHSQSTSDSSTAEMLEPDNSEKTANSSYFNDSDSFENPENSSVDSRTVSESDEIVFIKRYSNCAWGRQDCGFIITADGRVFEFDYSYEEYPEEVGYVPPTFEEKIAQRVANGNPDDSVDPETIAECAELARQIDVNAEVTEESVACDAGQTGVYAVIDGEQVLLAASGDWNKELQDDSAKEIVRLLSKNEIIVLPDFGQDFGLAPKSFSDIIRSIF